MKYISFLFVLSLFAAACSTEDNQQQQVERSVDEFYQVFNERSDFERFLTFYAEEAVLEDIVNGDRIIGKETLRDFFDWGNPGFEKLDDNTLVIEQ